MNSININKNKTELVLFFKKKFNLDDHLIFQLFESLKIENIKKGEHLFTQGVLSNRIGIILSGLIYSVYEDQNGKSFIKNFYFNYRAICPWASLVEGKESHFTAIAIENSIVAFLNFETLINKMENDHKVSKMMFYFLNKAFLERENREYSTLMHSPLKRYEQFRSDFEPIIQSIPQHMIASYLGISPVSLSRLKNNNKVK